MGDEGRLCNCCNCCCFLRFGFPNGEVIDSDDNRLPPGEVGDDSMVVVFSTAAAAAADWTSPVVVNLSRQRSSLPLVFPSLLLLPVLLLLPLP